MRKYDDVERLGKEEVEDITTGMCYIFEKIDGANCSVTYNAVNGLTICSRSQVVYMENGTQRGTFRGLTDYVLSHPTIIEMVKAYPDCIFYGEWLVKHTIQYPAHLCNRIWFFDIYDPTQNLYSPYSHCESVFKQYEVSFLSPLAEIENPTDADLHKYLNVNNFNGSPRQEGIVIKRYTYINKFGRQQWAKIVNPEFKEVARSVFCMQSDCCKMGAYIQDGGWFCSKCEQPTTVTKVRYFDSPEEKIAEQYVQPARVKKILNKILDISPEAPHNQFGGLERHTARILETTWYDVLTEDMHDIVKKFKYPVIYFKKLRKCVVDKTKVLYFNMIGNKDV